MPLPDNKVYILPDTRALMIMKRFNSLMQGGYHSKEEYGSTPENHAIDAISQTDMLIKAMGYQV